MNLDRLTVIYIKEERQATAKMIYRDVVIAYAKLITNTFIQAVFINWPCQCRPE